MVTKGFVVEKGESLYKIRIPLFDRINGDIAATSDADLSYAPVCSQVSCSYDLSVGDVVFVGFEENNRYKPVVLGVLYGTKNSDTSITLNTLTANNDVSFPFDSTICNIKGEEIACISGVKENIAEQFNTCRESIQGVSDSIESVTKNVLSTDNGIKNQNEDYAMCLGKNNTVKGLIGEKTDTGESTLYGNLYSIDKKIAKTNETIGSMEDGTTVVQILENLKSDLLNLKNATEEAIKTPVAPTTTGTTGQYPEYSTGGPDSVGGSGIQGLRSKFPAGFYWNHAPTEGNTSYNGVNNQDGYTSTPCPKHHNCGTPTQTCNGYAPAGYETSWQCMGYANKCGHDVSGYDPETSSMWKTYSSSDALASVKAGDIVRYKNDGHSIYVIAVSGETVTYTDCNSDGRCVIRWDVTIQKSTLKDSFSYLRSCP